MPTDETKKHPAYAPTQPAMPAQPQTVAIDKPPPWAIALTEKVVTGFDKVDVNMGLITSDLAVVKGRVENLEKARDLDVARSKVADERAAAASIKTKQNSDHNLENAAKLADVITWRQNVTNELANTKTELADVKSALATAATERVALATTVDAHGVQLVSIEQKTDDQTKTLTTIANAVTEVKGWVERNPKFVAALAAIASWSTSQLYSYLTSRGH